MIEYKDYFYKEAPVCPGVYIFHDIDGNILYIGKAKSLRKRLASYDPRKDEIQEKITRMKKIIKNVELIECSNEFDALLLESQMIRRIKPKFNSQWKDDKSYIYISISKAEFPLISSSRKKSEKSEKLFGPFTSSSSVRLILRYLRRIIPYCSQKNSAKKPCFYTHIGLCSPCPGYIKSLSDEKEKAVLKKKYLSNIHKIISILEGKHQRLRKQIFSLMQKYSKAREYEKALHYKKICDALDSMVNRRYIDDSLMPQFIDKDNLFTSQCEKLRLVLQKFGYRINSLKYIECFDMSHLMGKNAVGSMVRFDNGIPNKNMYRKFKIKNSANDNDFDMINEVLNRRLNHKEWLYPDLFIIDGGKPQILVFGKVLNNYDLKIPFIGIEKGNESLLLPQGYKKYLKLPDNSPALHLVQRMRDEAHRFAKSYHVKLRNKEFLNIG